MDPLSLAELLQAAASAAAAGRLIQLGSAQRQPALLCYLIYLAIDLTALGVVPPTSRLYFRMFFWGTAIGWIAAIFAVREMFTLTFDRYRGIRTAGRWVLYVATGLAAAVSLALTYVFGHPLGRASQWIYYVQMVDRSVVLALAMVIVGIVLFLSRFPLHLTRNTYVSTGFFSAVFLSEAAQILFDSLNRYLFSSLVDIIQAAFAAVCLLAWAFLLQPERLAGIPQRVVFENPGESELLHQLDSLNQMLSRVGRR